ncbi:hypothetical protein [Micromonospora carbonacea]|uniref:Uncharacterized protein n=1 Tax=Micromonospora carbonacea TaxID=47853 RepID=A0A7H8XSN1_9ACTN|nr:hypothetical protein [Micromonospora carbonacea]MBB5830047.1 hypothetical protein [Micromonospora carbonacea]QLD28023.1 hypothetical protein HXZ27_30595 [Micromonospora carbonacea]
MEVAQLAGPDTGLRSPARPGPGTRGTHGRGEQANNIGFRNEETIADIDPELDRMQSALDVPSTPAAPA